MIVVIMVVTMVMTLIVINHLLYDCVSSKAFYKLGWWRDLGKTNNQNIRTNNKTCTKHGYPRNDTKMNSENYFKCDPTVR